MKYFMLIWAGMWRKRARTVLTVLSVVTAFVLYGTLHGVTSSLDDAIAEMSITRLRVMNRVNIIDSLPRSLTTKRSSAITRNRATASGSARSTWNAS
jgi:putative ABC transport system permease protein